MSEKDRKSRRSPSPASRRMGDRDRPSRDVRDRDRDRDVRDIRGSGYGGGSGSGSRSGRGRDKSPDRHRRDASRSRSRSRERERDRERRREERRKNKTSGWDQPPAPGTATAPPPGAPGFAGLHPARVAQLLAMGQMPTGDGPDRGHRRDGGDRDREREREAHDRRDVRGENFRPGGFGGGFLPNGGRDNPAALIPGASSQTPQQIASRQMRRLYIGNLLPDTTEEDLRVFFSKAMAAAHPTLEAGDCVQSVYLNLAKKFGFIEMRTPEEASACMALDSISFRGQQLKIRRPSDYQAAAGAGAGGSGGANPMAALGAQAAASLVAGGGGAFGAAGANPALAALMAGGLPSAAAAASSDPSAWNGVTSTQVPDGPNKVFCGGLPYNLAEHEVKELIGVYGPLRAFHLVKDKDNNQSKGFCFFEYVQPAITDDAIKGLNGLEIRGKTLTVRRAQARGAMGAGGAAAALSNPLAALGLPAALMAAGGMPGLPGLSVGFPGGLNPLLLAQAAAGALPMASAAAAAATPATRILCLLQMVTADELGNDAEYKEICEDIETECRKYGDVKALVIPRPPATSGVGKVFVEFADPSMAAKARADLEGRQFANRTVAAAYWDEQRFANKDYA